MMNKRGQGLSITTIIVAAIALIVLVVLVAIFTGRLGIFSRFLGEREKNLCEGGDLGGRCGDVCDINEVRAFGAKGCSELEPICCIPSEVNSD